MHIGLLSEFASAEQTSLLHVVLESSKIKIIQMETSNAAALMHHARQLVMMAW
jgi:hypothetical protein